MVLIYSENVFTSLGTIEQNLPHHEIHQKSLNISVNFESTYLLDAYLKPNLT